MAIRCDVVREVAREPKWLDRPTAIVIPAFNEAQHIRKLLTRCAMVQPKIVLVVDDKSTDQTAAEAEKARPNLSSRGVELRVLSNEHNLGKQGSVRHALRSLRGANVEAVALIDGDGQHDPTELPRLVALLETHDVVIGARSQDEMPIHRQLSNALVNIGFLAIGGVDFLDVQSGLRVYRKELSDVLAEYLPSEGGYGLEHESLSLIARHAQQHDLDVRVVATPASCRYGEAKSKIKPEDVVELAYQTIRHAWRIRRAA